MRRWSDGGALHCACRCGRYSRGRPSSRSRAELLIADNPPMLTRLPDSPRPPLCRASVSTGGWAKVYPARILVLKLDVAIEFAPEAACDSRQNIRPIEQSQPPHRLRVQRSGSACRSCVLAHVLVSHIDIPDPHCDSRPVAAD